LFTAAHNESAAESGDQWRYLALVFVISLVVGDVRVSAMTYPAIVPPGASMSHAGLFIACHAAFCTPRHGVDSYADPPTMECACPVT
jgi:hypothetical protein